MFVHLRLHTPFHLYLHRYLSFWQCSQHSFTKNPQPQLLCVPQSQWMCSSSLPGSLWSSSWPSCPQYYQLLVSAGCWGICRAWRRLLCWDTRSITWTRVPSRSWRRCGELLASVEKSGRCSCCTSRRWSPVIPKCAKWVENQINLINQFNYKDERGQIPMETLLFSYQFNQLSTFISDTNHGVKLLI